MKDTIIKLKQLAALLFDNNEYYKFCNYVDSNEINNARLLIDNSLSTYEDEPNNNFELNIANKMSDLVIDLMINEIDGGGRKGYIGSIN